MKKQIQWLGLSLLLVVLACNKTKDVVSPDNALNLEFKDEAIIFDEKTPNPVIAIDTASQIYTFKSEAFDTKPKAGQTILVAGEIMRKVVSVQEKSGVYEIQTTDAALTDIIRNGELSWEITPEWDQISGIAIDGQPDISFENLRRRGPIKVSYTQGNIEHTMEIEPTLENGKINACRFAFTMAQLVDGKPAMAFTAEGTVKLPTQKTNITVKDGKLQDFKADNKGMTADVKLSINSAGGQSGAHSLKLPNVALKIPIRYIPTPSGPVPLPIPVDIEIGIQFVTQLSVTNPMSSAQSSSEVSLSADAGFEYKGTSVETSGSIANENFKSGTFDSASYIGFPVDIQFGVAFPRVSLNIAGQEVAYVHTGFTTGSSLSWGPLCKKGYVKMLVEGGYELKALGVTLLSDKKTFVERTREAKGEGCP